MPKEAHKVVVIGHRNPDTDSICSAIAYAELKNRTSNLVCEPRRAGKMNQETQFVLQKFGVEPPRMCTDVNPKIRDVDYREMEGVDGSISLRRAWEIMRDRDIDTLPVVSPEGDLLGVITVKDIATANMDVFDTAVLAKTHTTYKNILETLGGEMVVGSEDGVCTAGNVHIGTATPEMLESAVEKGDIVILTNRYESQLCAIEQEASLLIICNDSKVAKTISRIAAETGVDIMTVPFDTYAAGSRQAHQPVRPHLLLYDHPEHPQVHPGDPGGRRDPGHGQEPPPLFPDPGRERQILRHGQPPQHHQSEQAADHPGGPQRGHPGGGGL